MPTVSVIMNCFNCVRYLREALDSVCAQTYKDFEVIFWDNLSTDGSVEIAKQYPVRFFSNTSLLPLGESRNLAIAQARGKYIAFLDCDDVWLPTKLEKQVALLESNSELVLVYADCYHINAGGKILLQSFKASPPHRGYIFNALFANNFIPMVTVVARKNMMPSFNNDFSIAEEYDVWLKMASVYPFDYINEPLAEYRIYPEQASNRMRVKAAQEELIIMNYWLSTRPWLKRIARKKRAQISASLAYYYLQRHNVGKFIVELYKFLFLLPENIALVPKIARRVFNA